VATNVSMSYPATRFTIPVSLSKRTYVRLYTRPNCPYCTVAKEVLPWLQLYLGYNFHYEIHQETSIPHRMELGTVDALDVFGGDTLAASAIDSMGGGVPLTFITDRPSTMGDGKPYVIGGCDIYLRRFEHMPKEVLPLLMGKEDLDRMRKTIASGGFNGVWYANNIYKYYQVISNISNATISKNLATYNAYRAHLLDDVERKYVAMIKKSKIKR
jgi:hypothetical protein